MSGYARGASGVDWEDRIDFARLRRERVDAVREALTASDIDALLLWKDENVRYLTSLRAQLIAGKTTLLNGVLLTKDAGPILLCSGGEIDKARDGHVVAARLPTRSRSWSSASSSTASSRPRSSRCSASSVSRPGASASTR